LHSKFQPPQPFYAFYGDLKGPVTELCERWKLELIEEA